MGESWCHCASCDVHSTVTLCLLGDTCCSKSSSHDVLHYCKTPSVLFACFQHPHSSCMHKTGDPPATVRLGQQQVVMLSTNHDSIHSLQLLLATQNTVHALVNRNLQRPLLSKQPTTLQHLPQSALFPLPCAMLSALKHQKITSTTSQRSPATPTHTAA